MNKIINFVKHSNKFRAQGCFLQYKVRTSTCPHCLCQTASQTIQACQAVLLSDGANELWTPTWVFSVNVAD